MEKKNNMLEVIEKIAKANQEAKKACNQIEFYDIEQQIKKLTDELVNLYSDSLDSYKENLDKINKLIHYDNDFEYCHAEADKILEEFIKSLGYNELAEAYSKVGKWYS